MTLGGFGGGGGFVGGGGGGGGAGGGANSEAHFVYHPGGTPGPRTFVTEQALLDALNAEGDVPKVVSFRDDNTSPIVMSLSGHDWSRTRWMGTEGRGNSFGPSATVHMADGATFPGLLRFGPNISVRNLNTTTSPVTLANADHIWVSGNSNLESAVGGVAMFSGSALSGGDLIIAFITIVSSFGLNTDEPVIDMPVSGTLLFMQIGVASFVDDDCLTSGAGVSRQDTLMASGASIGNQTGWGGTVSRLATARSVRILNPAGGVAAATAGVTAEFNNLIRCDVSGGAFVQTLPAIGTASLPFQGRSVVVKEESGNAGLTVDGAGADTIDGGAGAVAIPAGGSRTFTSDGVSNWIITGGYL